MINSGNLDWHRVVALSPPPQFLHSFQYLIVSDCIGWWLCPPLHQFFIFFDTSRSGPAQGGSFVPPFTVVPSFQYFTLPPSPTRSSYKAGRPSLELPLSTPSTRYIIPPRVASVHSHTTMPPRKPASKEARMVAYRIEASQMSSDLLHLHPPDIWARIRG